MIISDTPRIALYGDLLQYADFASVGVASGGEDADPDYQLPSLFDLDPLTPFKSTDGTVDLEVVFDAGAPLRLDGVALAIHNISAGANARWQMHSANAWGAPTMDAPLSIAAVLPTGHSRAPWCDLTQVAGYTAAGLRYARLVVPATGTPVQIGELILARQLRSFVLGIERGVKPSEAQPLFRAIRTSAGVVTRYTLPILTRSFVGRLVDAADAPLLRQLAAAEPFLWITDPSDTTDGGWLARLGERTKAQLTWSDDSPEIKNIDIEIEELSRGLPL